VNCFSNSPTYRQVILEYIGLIFTMFSGLVLDVWEGMINLHSLKGRYHGNQFWNLSHLHSSHSHSKLHIATSMGALTAAKIPINGELQTSNSGVFTEGANWKNGIGYLTSYLRACYLTDFTKFSGFAPSENTLVPKTPELLHRRSPNFCHM